MSLFDGKTLSWKLTGQVLELALHHQPCNEIGFATLEELENFAEHLKDQASEARVLIIHSQLPAGFSAGADLRETYRLLQSLTSAERAAGVRNFLERIHGVYNSIDALPLITVAAVHGVVFGGGFELALTCDMIVADRSARFCFPELRLGLIPGFGGIPRLKRDLGNSFVRDLLFTGRSISAAKAAAVGLVSQLVAEGEAFKLARATASQITKFDAGTRVAAKKFIKPIPREELRREIEIFCELFTRPAVMAGLKKFVENTGPMPYQP